MPTLTAAIASLYPGRPARAVRRVRATETGKETEMTKTLTETFKENRVLLIMFVALVETALWYVGCISLVVLTVTSVAMLLATIGSIAWTYWRCPRW